MGSGHVRAVPGGLVSGQAGRGRASAVAEDGRPGVSDRCESRDAITPSLRQGEEARAVTRCCARAQRRARRSSRGDRRGSEKPRLCCGWVLLGSE